MVDKQLTKLRYMQWILIINYLLLSKHRIVILKINLVKQWVISLYWDQCFYQS